MKIELIDTIAAFNLETRDLLKLTSSYFEIRYRCFGMTGVSRYLENLSRTGSFFTFRVILRFHFTVSPRSHCPCPLPRNVAFYYRNSPFSCLSPPSSFIPVTLSFFTSLFPSFLLLESTLFSRCLSYTRDSPLRFTASVSRRWNPIPRTFIARSSRAMLTLLISPRYRSIAMLSSCSSLRSSTEFSARFHRFPTVQIFPDLTASTRVVLQWPPCSFEHCPRK